ncbi:ABC-type bacteriocin/lantibiotic exporter with double-glycine peptidase domain [Croceifilum oryzae]|uniref:ABC-type bacteriocin/lantibiotic exporter with double-glycine peptidase domain n=1 Tax=Croceifilum oryzae TaxID=1553429 RepID=A0AAJ1WSP9_9BACL|nr:peptidase domain-containing ABC transporter [Croceifilum oryzae]MDQ0417955.1 ABC-type bacteriocin/lantibiotic exporter with double-glycine peptidase domain [Croceifilum oryzae]
MFKRVPFIEQMEHSECGLASLAMILNYHGHKITLTEIRERYGVSKRGISLGNLLELGNDFHLKCNVYKGKLTELPFSVPAILYWEDRHYVVLERLGKNYATIVDPDNGRRKISIEELEKRYSGYLFQAEPDEGFIIRKKKSQWGFLLSFLRGQSTFLSSLILVSFLLQGLGFLIPQLTQWITDEVIMPGKNEYLMIIGIGIAGLFLFHQFFSFLRSYFIVVLQTKLDLALMTAFVTQLFHLPFSFFENRKGGELVFRANSNVYIRQILSSKTVSLVIDSILVISYACLLFYQEWHLGLMITLLSFLLFLILTFSTRWTRKLTDQQISAQTKTQAYLTENIFGICDVKVLGAEEKVHNHWRNLFTDQLAIAKKHSLLTSAFDTISSGIQFTTPLLVLWMGATLVLDGSLTLGQLLGISALSSAFMVPIISLSSSYSQFIILGSYIRRLQDVIESKPEGTKGEIVSPLSGEIELRNVSFKYGYFSENVLSDIQLHIHPGEKVAIVGASGSGKSTLAKILIGLYTPHEGTIFFDNKPLSDINIQSLRQQVGVVLQETRLFHGTIQNNISLFDKKVPMEKLIEAAHMADIHQDIVEQPLGYNTIVSEGGSNFSGGQRQRLLLARALLHQPNIILLDEATSALDNIREANIKRCLSELHCTQIMIAHRLSTIQQSDRILVMHEGKLVENGTHEELLQKGGFYHALYTSQEV